MSFLRKIVDWYLIAPVEPRSLFQIIAWWEIRRIPYNLLVAVVGIPSFILFAAFIVASNKLQPGDDLVEPMAILFTPVAMNIGYTFGEIAEIIFGEMRQREDKSVATSLLTFGTVFSLLVVIFPAAYWGLFLLLLKLGIAK